VRNHFLFILTINLVGCTTFPQVSRQVSGIDAAYRLSRVGRPSNILGGSSPGVTFYQRVLSQTLGSHCSMYPSDSRNAQILSARCGPVISILRPMARFYLEPDAATLALPFFARENRIVFEDLPSDCRLF
jgi:hypothetical protein